MKLALVLICALSIARIQGMITVKIGALFHEGDEPYEKVFDDAVFDLNTEYEGAFKFESLKLSNVSRSAVSTVKATCDILSLGPSVIFGPFDSKLRLLTANVAQKYGIPHILYSFMMEDEDVPSSNIRFNAYPSSTLLGELIAQAQKLMSWHTYVYIYQTKDALSRVMRTLRNHPGAQRTTAFRELTNQTYENLVKELQTGGHSSFMIDAQPQSLRELLLTMRRLGLMTDYFMALLTSLDTSLISMSDINTRQTVANITYFRFIQHPDEFRSIEECVLYDAIMAYGNAIDELSKDLGARRVIDALNAAPAVCQGDGHFDFGQIIAEAFRGKTQQGRYTGFMRFNQNGEREFEVDMVVAQGGKVNTIATYRNKLLVLKKINYRDLNVTVTEVARNKIFRVVTKVGPPYVIPVNSGGRLIDEGRFKGYCIDLVAKIEEFLGIKCDFYLVPDGNYGSKDPKTKKWNGIINEVLELKADFGICDLTVTSERQNVVDFTTPFMNLGISILYSKSEAEETAELFAFMSPFSVQVWIYVTVACLAVSAATFFLAQLAPDEWTNPHPCKDDPEELENNFTAINSVWATICALMQQGSDVLPRASSIRLLTTAWWFFVLILAASYTANLTAFLTSTKLEEKIGSIKDLSKQTKVKYGAVANASTYWFFRNSNLRLYQRIYTNMENSEPSVFVKSNEEGVGRVLRGQGRFAFFTESPNIEYEMEKHCDLAQVGGLLDHKGFGIAMPANSPYRSMLNSAILHLRENGELQGLKNKWWKGSCDSRDRDRENSDELGMLHLRGVFLVLVFGSAVATVVGIVEFVWNARKVARSREVSVWVALRREIKIAVNCKVTSRAVNLEKELSELMPVPSTPPGDFESVSRK